MPAPRSSSPPLRLLQRVGRAVEAIVRQAADGVARARGADGRTATRRKAVGDFVTALDVRCERLLRRQLLALLPAAGFLGEETRSSGLDRDYVWVVDPIDGTSNFARGHAHWSVAVALLWRGEPVIGVAWCEPEAALYRAVRGGGARRNGRRLGRPRGRFDDGAMVGCQWHRGQQDLRFLAALQRRGARVRTYGCTVAQLIDVACGRLDGNVQQQGRLWDFAAAGLIVLESGARLTDWAGRPVFPLASLTTGHLPTLAAAANVHARIVGLMAPFAGDC